MARADSRDCLRPPRQRSRNGLKCYLGRASRAGTVRSVPFHVPHQLQQGLARFACQATAACEVLALLLLKTLPLPLLAAV